MADGNVLDIRGSGWSATGTIVEELAAADRRAVNLLRVAAERDPADDRTVAAVARIHIDRAAIVLTGRSWAWSADDEKPVLVDLVVALDPEPASGGSAPRRATPLAGSIDLIGLVSDDSDDLDDFHTLIGLEPAEGAAPVLTPDGVLVRGSRSLPWDPGTVSGPFTAHPAGSEIRVTPELARLTAKERSEWLRSWQNFADVLAADDGPQWMRLVVPSPDEIPAVAFFVQHDDTTRSERLSLPIGSLVVELTDAAPGNDERPTRSVMRLHGNRVVMTDTGIHIEGGEPQAGDTHDVVVTTTLDAADGWTERVDLDDVTFEPDPVALTRRLDPLGRAGRGPGHILPIHTALADGWLVSTVPAVTDQDYVDADIEVSRAEPSGLLTGAVVWGNDDPALRAAARDDGSDDDVAAVEELEGRTRWSLTVVDTAAFAGSWTLTDRTTVDGDRRTVDSGTLELFGVSCTADGFWWIAETRRANRADVGRLPEPTSWVGALGSVALHAGSALAQRRPSAVSFAVTAGLAPRPLANDTRLVGELTTIMLNPGVEAGVAGDLGFEAGNDTAWCRHPVLPTVQAFPLNDPGGPGSEPSSTRELMPLTLNSTATGWSLSGNETDWLEIGRASLRPVDPWITAGGRSDVNLTQALLSMPGAELVPTADGPAFRFRHDLPLLDEGAGFATIDDTNGAGPVLDPTVQPLMSWDRLSELADLAALEGAVAFDLDPPSGQDTTDDRRPVTDERRDATSERLVAVDLSAYPGSLSLDGTTVDPEAGIDAAQSTATNGHARMRSGSIRLDLADSRTRDQLDVGRGETTVDGTLARVPVHDGSELSHEAVSTLQPHRLIGPAVDWPLSFRGLPMRVAADGERRFEHDDRDDLLANESFRTHRWWLGNEPIDLGGLEVHPVRLTSVTVDGDGTVTDVVIDVRLQLPAGAERRPRPELSGLVRLHFSPTLKRVEMLDDVGVWPVGAGDDSGDGGVKLQWRGIELVDEGLTVSGVTAHFHLFDQPWLLPIDKPLRFELNNPHGDVVGEATTPDGQVGDDGLRWTRFVVTIDLSSGRGHHQTDLHLEARLGGRDVEVALIVHPGSEHLTDPTTSTGAKLFWFDRRLEAIDTDVVIGPRSLQFAWSKAGAVEEADGLVDFLPGMTLTDDRRPGVVSLAFVPEPNTKRGWPDLDVVGAHAELVFGCSWNADERWADELSVDRAASWFEGALSIGYLGVHGDDGWNSSFLLDGVVSVASLVSYAGNDHPDGSGMVTPASVDERASFIRHVARILFQQHRLTDLRVTDGSTLVGLDRAIELHAVVEHVLTHIVPDHNGPGYLEFGSERFAVPQVVHLRRPDDARADLQRQVDSAEPIRGFAAAPVADLLAGALDALPDDAVVIDAAVSALVRREVLEVVTAGLLRAIPTGTVQAARVALSDHLDSAPLSAVRGETGGLTQLNLPFLAVIAPPPDESSAAAPPPLLSRDPVDWLRIGATDDDGELAAMLASRVRPDENGNVATIDLGSFDGKRRRFDHAAERRIISAWTAMADTSIDRTAGVDSILASEPDALGRMGDPVALDRVVGLAVINHKPRPDSFVAFDGSGTVTGGPLVGFDFGRGTEPFGSIPGSLEYPAKGWRLTDRFLQHTSNAGRDSVAKVVGAAGPLVDAIGAARAFSIHLRIRPDRAIQSGPDRILSLSSTVEYRLFTIGQEKRHLVIRVRSNGDDLNGDDEQIWVMADSHHLKRNEWVDIAYVYDGTYERVFVNGEAVAITVGRSTHTRRRRRKIDFASWSVEGMDLVLGNERSGHRRWLGAWERVAVYAGAVTPDDLASGKVSSGGRSPLPWLATGAQIRLGFDGTMPNRARHHVATNILPVDVEGGGDLVPSPYASFAVVEAAGVPSGDDAPTVVATVAELLTEDRDGGLVSVGGKLWDGDPGDDVIERWATAVRTREHEYTRRTVVRTRRVVAAAEDGTAVAAELGFLVLPPRALPPRLGWQALPMRTGRSHHPERHYGSLPSSPGPAEVVAPLVVGAEAVRDNGRRLSGLVFDVALRSTAGLAPGDSEGVALWSGLARRVRFRETSRSDGRGEPEGFDVADRAALAPVAPAPPLPVLTPKTASEFSVSAALEAAQYVAVDQVRHIVTGSRPGAMTEARPIQQQRRDGITHSTDTLPTTLRVPRPVTTHFSTDPTDAVRPWGGLFDRQQSVWVRSNRFEIVQVRDRAALLIEVDDPAAGTITRDRTEPIRLTARHIGPGSGTNVWTIDAPSLEDTVTVTDADNPRRQETIEVPVDEWLQSLLRGTPVGSEVRLRLDITHDEGGGEERRTVELPLTVAAGDDLPLLSVPRFCRFEDPEYNRRISTGVAKTVVDGVTLTTGGPETGTTVQGCRVILSRDRTAHVPGATAFIGIEILAPDGNAVPNDVDVTARLLVGPDEPPAVTDLGLETVAAADGARWMCEIELASVLNADSEVRLEVTAGANTALTGSDGSTSFVAPFTLVESQEPPSTTAAYALLRRDGETVSCPRYALGPPAARIELVDRQDVFTEIMRYRAEFHWTDIVRAGTRPRYEMQKVSHLGETHVPSFEDIS